MAVSLAPDSRSNSFPMSSQFSLEGPSGLPASTSEEWSRPCPWPLGLAPLSKADLWFWRCEMGRVQKAGPWVHMAQDWPVYRVKHSGAGLCCEKVGLGH